MLNSRIQWFLSISSDTFIVSLLAGQITKINRLKGQSWIELSIKRVLIGLNLIDKSFADSIKRYVELIRLLINPSYIIIRKDRFIKDFSSVALNKTTIKSNGVLILSTVCSQLMQEKVHGLEGTTSSQNYLNSLVLSFF